MLFWRNFNFKTKMLSNVLRTLTSKAHESMGRGGTTLSTMWVCPSQFLVSLVTPVHGTHFGIKLHYLHFRSFHLAVITLDLASVLQTCSGFQSKCFTDELDC